MMKFKHNLKLLFSQEEISAKIKALAAELNEKYKDNASLSFVGIMNGSIFFFTDLLKEIDVPIKMDTVTVSSYSGMESTRKAVFHKEITKPIVEGQDVIIIEDLIDSGLTLTAVYEHINSLNPKSLQIITLGDKTTCHPDFKYEYRTLFDFPDKFIVGYGLETDDLYRQLTDIYYVVED